MNFIRLMNGLRSSKMYLTKNLNSRIIVSLINFWILSLMVHYSGRLLIFLKNRYFRTVTAGSTIESLRTWTETECSVQSIDWERLKPLIRDMKRLPPVDFWEVFRHFIRLFDEYKCKNASVITKLFRLPLKTKPMFCASFLAKLLTCPYKSDESYYTLHHDAIQCAIICTNYEFVRDLLKYGVMYIAPNDVEDNWCFSWCWMDTFLVPTPEVHVLRRKEIKKNFESLPTESRRRMLVVFKIVQVIIQKKSFHSLHRRVELHMENFLCLRIAFETIPEPYITREEIKSFLILCLCGTSADNLAEEICKAYEKFFPESVQPLAPRTLLHLSRCQVRDNLRKTGQLPHGVTDLHIPKIMKEYIQCTGSEFISDEYKKWNFLTSDFNFQF